jgi:hypothetical protein
VILSEKDGGSLTIKEKSFKLVAEENKGLNVDANEAKLQLGGNISLRLKQDLAALTHPQGITIKMTDGKYIKLGPDGVTAEDSVLTKIKGQLVQAG